MFKKFIAGLTSMLAIFGSLVIPAFAANSTVVVRSSDLETSIVLTTAAANNKWFFYNDENDTIDNTLGSFVTGPSTPPAGIGSAQVSVTGTQRRNLSTYQFRGTPLANITELKFSTYNPSAGNGGSANRSGYLNFNVDFNGTDTWQRRLVFVPSANGTVVQNSWQEWDAIQGGNAKWSYSGATWPVSGELGTTTKTWTQILSQYPGVRIRLTDSWLGMRVGEPYADGYTENIDSFKFGTASGTTTFDFEPAPVLVGPPTTKAECKNGGWQTFNNPEFKNQGKCIDYVEKHDHKVRGNNLQYMANGLLRFAEFEMNTADQKGNFEYKDGNKDFYKVKVSKVKVSGNQAWFAGVVTKAKNPAWVGNWLFAKVEDNSPDKVWGSFTTKTTAENGVNAMSTPTDGPFSITKGNIKVN